MVQDFSLRQNNSFNVQKIPPNSVYVYRLSGFYGQKSMQAIKLQACA